MGSGLRQGRPPQQPPPRTPRLLLPRAVSEINTACSLILHQAKAKEANHPQADLALLLARHYIGCLA